MSTFIYADAAGKSNSYPTESPDVEYVPPPYEPKFPTTIDDIEMKGFE